MLYMVNKSPMMTHNLETCLEIAGPGDPILLYEDGVYGAMASGRLVGKIQAALKTHSIYALDADLEARGIRRTLEGIQVVSYDGFVGLVEDHDPVPWL
jgi:tRNA 2-thiouridine synthesizing protein B